MSIVSSLHRCLLVTVALTVLIGTFFHFRYDMNALRSVTNHGPATLLDDINFTNAELRYLQHFNDLLWLSGIENYKYMFGTYDSFWSPASVGRLIIYRMINSTNGDYIKFIGDNDQRAIYGLQTVRRQIFGRPIWVPENSQQFLRKWVNAEFVDCLGMNISDPETTPVISEKFVENVARFRDFIESHNSIPFLFGGTLLGWYRECSFIKDTTDVDLAMKISTLNKTMLKNIKESSNFSLFWILGKVTDSLELSVYSDQIKIDLFFVYEEKNESWVGGMIVYERKKLRWLYPPIPRLCTGDLLGRLFHVPCNIKEILEADYGNWIIPQATENFTWYKSHQNVHEVGYWDESEWENVYKQFG